MHLTDFTARVLDIVQSIPEGTTLTYKEVATQAGKPRAARAVGSIMRKNFNPGIPCHRVIRSDGKIGNYNRGGASVKRALLITEKALKI